MEVLLVLSNEVGTRKHVFGRVSLASSHGTSLNPHHILCFSLHLVFIVHFLSTCVCSLHLVFIVHFLSTCVWIHFLLLLPCFYCSFFVYLCLDSFSSSSSTCVWIHSSSFTFFSNASFVKQTPPHTCGHPFHQCLFVKQTLFFFFFFFLLYILFQCLFVKQTPPHTCGHPFDHHYLYGGKNCFAEYIAFKFKLSIIYFQEWEKQCL
jgi:hypothetical protein